ncbi:hypothetical protein BKA83DRAFT_4492723 [Pisolithus microcarpus]|nr:hypothetical protein BKA83DRAFT_4492723 [Pisolithus microcarpus]
MFPNALFNNPWHSWHSPNHLEDAQTISKNNLFNEDMMPTCNPGDHTIGTTTLAQSQLNPFPPAAHAQADPLTSVVPPDSMVYAASWHMVMESECDIDVQKLHVLSQHNTLEPEHMSTSNVSTSKHMEPDTPTNLGTSIEGNVALMLYEKEEVINKLQRRIWQQGQQNDVVSDLQSVLKQRENELLGLCEALQQVQSVQEQTAQQYETQLEELQKQFESSMQSHINKLQAAKMAEIKTHAEKERGLANIKQCYAQLKKPVHPEKHLDTEIGSSAEPHPTHPQATPSTPHLDAISHKS